MDKQQRWIDKCMATGTCCRCGQPLGLGRKGKHYCQPCLTKRNLKQRLVRQWQPWQPGGRGRPPHKTLAQAEV